MGFRNLIREFLASRIAMIELGRRAIGLWFPMSSEGTRYPQRWLLQGPVALLRARRCRSGVVRESQARCGYCRRDGHRRNHGCGSIGSNCCRLRRSNRGFVGDIDHKGFEEPRCRHLDRSRKLGFEGSPKDGCDRRERTHRILSRGLAAWLGSIGSAMWGIPSRVRPPFHRLVQGSLLEGSTSRSSLN